MKRDFDNFSLIKLVWQMIYRIDAFVSQNMDLDLEILGRLNYTYKLQ